MLESFQRYWHGDQDTINLLLDLRDPEAPRRHRIAAAGGVLFQLLAVTLALALPDSGARRLDGPEVVMDFRRSTPVFIPEDIRDFKLTQKEPQRAKPATEVNLEQLLPRPEVRPSPSPSFAPPAPPQPRPFTPPKDTARDRTEVAARVDPPRIELPQGNQTSAPSGLSPQIAPPPEKPKLAFEPVGGPQGLPAGTPSRQSAVKPPSSKLDEAAREAVRSGAAGRVAVGDTGEVQGGGVGEVLRQTPSPGRPGSALELLSDPQGIDFKPYLIQVLAAVRRNWQSVMPESARFGQRGRVVVQFAIDRTGSVPKLVIASPSGTTALDRAAVAGVSASIPFPQLPPEYRGSEIRLQLVFSYNMPQR